MSSIFFPTSSGARVQTTNGRERRRGGRRNPVVAILAFAVVVLAYTAPLSARGPQSVADLAEKLQDSVVNISTTQIMKGARGIPLPQVPKGSPFEEFFEEFFNPRQRRGRPRKVSSLGSGFVIDPSGLIVTNNHVIQGADEIIVKFNDGTKLKVAKIIGRDSKTDLAILKVEPKKPLKAVPFGDSTRMRVGDWVMAIGNPFGLGGSVTVGIISAKKRDINAGPYDEFLQTDAAINRGNSGGPLFNMDGEVIGVNTAIISPTGGSIGIGFAVPASTALHVIRQLREFGETRRGWLGVRIQSVTEELAEGLGMAEPAGALVASITPDSPAAKAGIEVGDVILRFDGQDVPNMRILPRIVARTPIGKAVEVQVMRRGKKRTFKIAIGRLPEGQTVATAEKAKKKEEPKTSSILGLHIASLSDELRTQHKIGKKINGVVITKVDPASDAAQKNVKSGNVIVEVDHAPVRTPSDVIKKVNAVKSAGEKKAVLLLIDNGKNELRFVALRVPDSE